MKKKMQENNSQIIIYQTESGETKIDVRDFEISQQETPLAMVVEKATIYNKGN